MELADRSTPEPVVLRFEMAQNYLGWGWGLLEHEHRAPYKQSSQVNRSGWEPGVYITPKFPGASGGMPNYSSYFLFSAQSASWMKISKACVLFRGREERITYF